MSRQFDVFTHPLPTMRAIYPFIIVLQHDSVGDRSEVVIAPLRGPISRANSRLYPMLDVIGSSVMMLTPDLAVINRRALSDPIANLAADRPRIIAAIDMLFVGS